MFLEVHFFGCEAHPIDTFQSDIMTSTLAKLSASVGNSFGPACGYAVSKYSETT